MRTFVKRLLIAAAGLLALALLAAGLAVQRQPLVAQRGDIVWTDVERALQLVRSHDPRRSRPGLRRSVVASQHDLDLLLNHGARRWLGGPAVRVLLQPYRAQVQASLALPANPWGGWLNLELRLRETADLPAIERLSVGRLPLPAWLAEFALTRLVARAGLVADAELARDVVQHVSLAQGVATLTYAWQVDTSQRVLAVLVPAPEQERLRAYTERLSTLAAGLDPAQPVSLAQLLTPLFELAHQRSSAGADAADENRAAIVVLAFHVTGRRLASVMPAARHWPQPRWLHVTLRQRPDFPQHFLVSALLAAEGSSPLANAVGLYKEVTDARHGSGFSFNDMAANRAGTRFGERAVSAPAALQAALAGQRPEADFMPDVADLPEFLPAAEFKRRFGGVGAPAYQQVLADIESRINATALLR
ncbi:MAG: hypothetical protein Q8N44_06540 [Rubrivivax sp.]|nr:hypothetical protein [Rubrivivax sp.]